MPQLPNMFFFDGSLLMGHELPARAWDEQSGQAWDGCSTATCRTYDSKGAGRRRGPAGHLSNLGGLPNGYWGAATKAPRARRLRTHGRLCTRHGLRVAGMQPGLRPLARELSKFPSRVCGGIVWPTSERAAARTRCRRANSAGWSRSAREFKHISRELAQRQTAPAMLLTGTWQARRGCSDLFLILPHSHPAFNFLAPAANRAACP